MNFSFFLINSFFILLILSISSCSYNNKVRKVENIMKAKVYLPEELFDSTCIFKIVRYVKPTTCTSCQLNLGVWRVFKREIITSCECTKANIADKFIAPNNETDVDITYTGDSIQGDFSRSVNIFYKGFDYPSVIKFPGR